MPPKQKPGLSKQDYHTPKKFLTACKRKLGIVEFAWDLAADSVNSASPFGFYSEEENSLVQQWDDIGDWLWLNPPFADIEPWVEKCCYAAQNGVKIAMLVPASVGSNWYRTWVDKRAYVLFLNGRLAFIPENPKLLYPKDCILILWTKWAVGSNVWSWKQE